MKMKMKMKNAVLSTFILLLTLPVFSQNDSLAWRQIDEQVWLPFVEHYEAWDAEKFNALHTPGMLRGGPWGLRTGEEYLGGNLKNWPEGKADGWERDIAFTFEQRVVGDGVAYEVGYYRVIDRRKGEPEQTYFGQFHVVLRLIDGIWKIAQDWDADEISGRPVTEEDFLRFGEVGILEN